MANALPCICCGKTLENVAKQVVNQPYDGTAFSTSGHYGSTTFDPMDGTELVVNICDECLTAAAGIGRVLHRQVKQVAEYDYQPWGG